MVRESRGVRPGNEVAITDTGIVYLDMLHQFLIPQLVEDGQEGRIRFQEEGPSPSLPWSTSAPVDW
jgi:hypothetical protein